MSKPRSEEGLGLLRLILVWSSLSPVFILWAIRGVDGIDDGLWVTACIILFLFPNALLLWFLRRAVKSQNEKTIMVKEARDQREHLLTYLFAMLIPLFDANLSGARDLLAIGTAFLFVMFLFWHMRLHYMNLLFALWNYRIFTVEAVSGTTPADREKKRKVTYAVISRRAYLSAEEPVTGYRLGGNVLVDKDQDD